MIHLCFNKILRPTETLRALLNLTVHPAPNDVHAISEMSIQLLQYTAISRIKFQIKSGQCYASTSDMTI